MTSHVTVQRTMESGNISKEPAARTESPYYDKITFELDKLKQTNPHTGYANILYEQDSCHFFLSGSFEKASIALLLMLREMVTSIETEFGRPLTQEARSLLIKNAQLAYSGYESAGGFFLELVRAMQGEDMPSDELMESRAEDSSASLPEEVKHTIARLEDIIDADPERQTMWALYDGETGGFTVRRSCDAELALDGLCSLIFDLTAGNLKITSLIPEAFPALIEEAVTGEDFISSAKRIYAATHGFNKGKDPESYRDIKQIPLFKTIRDALQYLTFLVDSIPESFPDTDILFAVCSAADRDLKTKNHSGDNPVILNSHSTASEPVDAVMLILELVEQLYKDMKKAMEPERFKALTILFQLGVAELCKGRSLEDVMENGVLSNKNDDDSTLNRAQRRRMQRKKK